MDREADAGAPTHAAEGAENLSLATRTLSVQDGELPPPPQAEDRSSSSPFASHSSMPQPDDAAAPEAAAADHTGTAQPSAGAQEDGQKNNQPRAVRSVKRNKLTTERTGSDAADIARQRVSLDAHKGRDSSSGSSAGRKATKAAPPWSSSDSQRFGCGPGSEADGEPPEGGGEGVQERLFSTAASEALAAMPSGALPSWAGHQQQQQQQRQQPQDQQRQQRPTAQLRLFWGAAQAQGERDQFEDRYSLQPEFDLSPAVGVLADAGGAAAADAQHSAPAAADNSRGQPCCSYAAVFDGHRAADAADMAAKRLYVLLAGELGAANSGGGSFERQGVKEALVLTFSAMDFEIIADAARTGARCGSTACVALQIGSDLYVAHAGDSIAVLDRGGEPEVLTAKGSHKVDVPKEAARIKAKGGVVMPGGQRVVSPSGHHSLNMARALGDADYKTPHRIVSAVPDVRHVALGQQDKAVILASDGLWDVVSESEAVSVVKTSLGGGTAELKARATGDAAASLAHAAADALVGLALRKGTTDNVTAVVGILRWK